MITYQTDSSRPIRTSAPYDTLDLVIKSYDKLICDLHEAKDCHLSEFEEDAFTKNQHAQDIIAELLLGLDYTQGGEIANNLGRIYNFALNQLMTVSPSQDIGIYNHLINIFGNLKDAWVQINTRPC